MKTGDVVRLRNFEHHGMNGTRVGYSAKSLGKGVCFVAVILGTETKEKPLDLKAAMESLGWTLESEPPKRQKLAATREVRYTPANYIYVYRVGLTCGHVRLAGVYGHREPKTAYCRECSDK